MADLSRPRITGNDIPDDIWRIIASDLPRHTVFRFMSLNRTFFNLALDVKYGEVRWTKLDKRFISILAGLQNPIVAVHVRKLFIRAWFINYLMKRDALFRKSGAQSSASNSPAPLFNILALAFPKIFSRPNLSSSHPQDLGGFHDKERKLATATNNLSPKMLTNQMVCAVKGMRNVTQFDFEWRDLPLNTDTKVFLTSARTAFDKSLRNLALQAQIPKFGELLAITNFEHLDELNFNFDYRPDTPVSATKQKQATHDAEGTIAESLGLLEIIIPFISHRHSLLRTLVISSSSSVDLSQFFSNLPDMPILRRLVLNIHFDNDHLVDPSGILNILKTHSSSLLHVHLKVATPTVAIYSRARIAQQKRANWETMNNRLLKDSSTIRGLESLEIPFVSLQSTIPLLRRSTDSLTHLALTDHFLAPNELSSILDLFSHRPFDLQHLHIEVNVFDAALLKLLASRLPNLYSLILVYAVYSSSDDDFLAGEYQSYVPFADWKLCDIGTYEGRYIPPTFDGDHVTGTYSNMEHLIMARIYHLVPTIRFLQGFPVALHNYKYGKRSIR